MTLSNIDALSRDDARRLSPQEVDPIDEEAQTAPDADERPKARPEAARSPRDPWSIPRRSAANRLLRLPLRPMPADGDAVLFGALWPLGDVVKARCHRGSARAASAARPPGDLGYEFAPLSQDWHLARV